jgi:hypothetical protein
MNWQTDVTGAGCVDFDIVGTVLAEADEWVFKGILDPTSEMFDFNRRPAGTRREDREQAATAGRYLEQGRVAKPFRVGYEGYASVEARGRLPRK